MILFGYEVHTLYHATFKVYVESIIKMGGLVPDVNKNWDMSRKGVIYLCNDSRTAAEFCETAEYIPEEWFEDIIVYQVDADKLDISKIQQDENWNNDIGDEFCFTYAGIIPIDLLTPVNYR